MTALKACFEALGYQNVRTYIQSGNVLFITPDPGQTTLTGRIEDALSNTFSYSSRVVIRSHDEIRAIVAHAPPDFGNDLASYRYDVIFLKEPLTAAEAMQSVTTKAGVDQAYAGDGVLYFSRLISRAT